MVFLWGKRLESNQLTRGKLQRPHVGLPIPYTCHSYVFLTPVKS